MLYPPVLSFIHSLSNKQLQDFPDEYRDHEILNDKNALR